MSTKLKKLQGRKPPLRTGEPQPFSYGPYRVVIQRRVTEEEQISVECYEETKEAAEETFDLFMAAMRRHMLEHNERVVLITQGRLTQLERQIEARAEELRDLEAQLEETAAGSPQRSPATELQGQQSPGNSGEG